MRFIPGATSTTSLKVGAILEFGVIATNIATAVVLYPLVKRLSETVSLGYVTRLRPPAAACVPVAPTPHPSQIAGALRRVLEPAR